MGHYFCDTQYLINIYPGNTAEIQGINHLYSLDCLRCSHFEFLMTENRTIMDKPKSGPVIHERPKMPRATWEALRNHIIREYMKDNTFIV